MPVSFRLLSPFLLACLLGACTASTPGSSTGEHAASYRTGSTPINAPAKPASKPVADRPPARTPAAPPPVPSAPAKPQSRVIVMGTPLPGLASPVAPGPTPRPLSSPQGAATTASPSAPTFQAPTPISTDKAAPPPAATQGPPTGFGGIAWGTPAKSIPGLAVHQVNAPLSDVTYIWPAGPRQVMGAPIRDAFLEFYQGRFYHVWINLDGVQAYQTALSGLKAAYGPPTTEKPEKYYQSWTIGDVNIYCAYHPEEREGDVSFFYQPIYNRLDAARKVLQRRQRPARRKTS